MDSNQVRMSDVDRLIMSTKFNAQRELDIEIVNKYKDTIKTLEEGQEISIEPEVVAAMKDGKIYITRTGTAETNNQSKLDVRAMVLLLKHQQNAGQATLKILWDFHKNQKITFLGEAGEEYNPDDLLAFVEKTFASLMDGQMYYVNQLAYVVLRIFQPVYAAELTKKYFADDNGEIITVDRLVNGKNMLGKLRDASAMFPTLSLENQKIILNSIVLGTQAELKNEKEKITGKGPITGSYIVHTTGDTYKVEFEELTDLQMQYLEKALGKGWEAILR